jgi:hypothetical protein
VAEVSAALEAITLEMAVVDERAATVHGPDRRTDPAGTARTRVRARSWLVPARSWLVPALIAALALAGLGGWVALHRGEPGKVAEAAPPTIAAVNQAAPPTVAVQPAPVDPPLSDRAAPAEVAMPDVPVGDPRHAVANASPPRHRTHRDDHARKAPVLVLTSEKPQVSDEHVGSALLRVAPPPDMPPPPPPPKPVVLRAAIAGVDVHGSLPAADVRRAIYRTLPSIQRCMPPAAQNISAQLTIGESRRAEGVHASGGTAAACVTTALAAVRTETAPDVGEVEVIVHVTFAE